MGKMKAQLQQLIDRVRKMFSKNSAPR